MRTQIFFFLVFWCRNELEFLGGKQNERALACIEYAAWDYIVYVRVRSAPIFFLNWSSSEARRSI